MRATQAWGSLSQFPSEISSHTQGYPYRSMVKLTLSTATVTEHCHCLHHSCEPHQGRQGLSFPLKSAAARHYILISMIKLLLSTVTAFHTPVSLTKDMQDLCRQVGELAVLDEFAQVRQPALLGIRDVLQGSSNMPGAAAAYFFNPARKRYTMTGKQQPCACTACGSHRI